MSSGTIFAGTAIKTLKQNLNLNGVVTVGSGSADPSIAGFPAPIGSIYLRTNGTFFVKSAAPDTGWTVGVISGGPTTVSDATFFVQDDLDNTKRLQFQVAGVSTGTTRVLTVPNDSGTLLLGSGTAGQVAFFTGGIQTFYSATVDTGSVSFGGSSAVYPAAAFTALVSGQPTAATAFIAKGVGATGLLRAELYATTAGLPTGAALSTGSTVNLALLTNGLNTISFTFSSPATLVAGTTYAFVLRDLGTTGSWSFRIGPNVLSGTRLVTFDTGATWSEQSTEDYVFTLSNPGPLVPALTSEASLSPIRGGTGIVNNAANTLTFSGAFPLSLTLSASTSVILPTAGTLSTLAGTEALTNKTISASNATLTRLTIPAGAGAADGWIDLGNQSAFPSAPATNNLRLFANSTGQFGVIRASGVAGLFDFSGISANRTYVMPDAAGTMALTLSTLNQTFQGPTFFSSTSETEFTHGIKIGLTAITVFKHPGTGTNHTLLLPGDNPVFAGEALSFTGGLYSLKWVHPGELTYIAGESLLAGHAVYIAPAGDGGRTQGEVHCTDASNPLRSLFVGFVIVGATTGSTVRIQTTGSRNGLSVAGTVGANAYLSATPGAVTASVTSTVVGVFVASNTVAIRSYPVVTVSSGFSDATFNIFNSAVTSKIAVFSAANITAATTRTFTFPDLSGTLALLENAQTFSGLKTFSNVSSIVFNAGIALGTSNTTSILPATSIPASYSVRWPGLDPVANAGVVLTHIGSNLLDWSFPGEISYTSGEALATNDVVYMSRGTANGDTGRTQGAIYKADATNDNRVDVLGFVVAGVAVSNIVRIQPSGEDFGFTGLIRGQPAYLSVTVPGALQTAAPSSAGQWIVQVGIATQATSIMINPGAAASAIFIEDSSLSLATVANNVLSPTAVSGLIFNGAAYRGVNADYTVYRSTTTTELAETGTLRAVYKTTSGTWEMDITSVGASGLTFTINSSGQVLFTSTNLTGTSYVGTMNWNIGTLG